jgi:signal transduction histidine kinase
MKLIEYVKSHLTSLLCQLITILLTDAVLLASTSLKKSLSDILYLNMLLMLICIVFFTYGFASSKSKYGKLRKALNKNQNIDCLIPEDDSFHSVLIRDIISKKCSEELELVSSYKNNIDELNNYITKWVHEIKLPISVAELMLENNKALEIEASRKYRKELERIKFLVNQVLYAGRASHYQEDLTISEFSLQKAVREAVKLNSYFLMSKNIEVIPENLSFNIVTDEKWVIYILEQILNNASKYVKQDGRVEIFADENDKSVSLHLKDNGIGIP